MFDTLPLSSSERVTCSISAAAKYEIPANIVLAIAEKENGRPGQWVRNSNGTHDVGSLQFNTSYLSTLARHGITPADVASAGCYAYDLAAWRLRQHLNRDRGDVWERAANYHSRTRRLNEIYRYDLKRRAARWADWLAARYPTHEVFNDVAITPRAPDEARAVRPTREATKDLLPRPTSRPGPTPNYMPRKLIVLTVLTVQ